MVAKRLVGPYGQRPTPADGARPSKSVASSHESRAGNARDRRVAGGEREEWETGSKESNANVLHVIFHFPTASTATTATTAATAAAAATVRLQ